MNDQTPAKTETVTNVKVAKEVEQIASIDPGLGAYQFGNLGEIVQFADLMSRADVMLPPHLRGKPAICMAVTMRSIQWKMDPFALAMETYQAKDGAPIGYSAKVFIAALQACAGLTLNYEYLGTYEIVDEAVKSAKGNVINPRSAKGNRQCRAWIEIKGRVFDYTTPKLDDITIKNSPLWHNDPDQQLAYYAGRGWVRRHRPGVMMGAYSDEEVQEMEPMRNVTPRERQSGFQTMIANARAESAEKQASEASETDQQEPIEGKPEETGEVDEFEEDHDPDSPEFGLGRNAAEGGLSRSECAYRDSPDKALDWFAGFDSVDSSDENEEEPDDDPA